MKILLTVNNNSFTTIHSPLFLIIPFLCAFYSVHSHKRITTDTISNIFIIQFFQHRRCIYIFIHTYIHAYIYIKSKRKDESYSTLNTWNKIFGIYLHLNKRSIDRSSATETSSTPVLLARSLETSRDRGRRFRGNCLLCKARRQITRRNVIFPFPLTMLHRLNG